MQIERAAVAVDKIALDQEVSERRAEPRVVANPDNANIVLGLVVDVLVAEVRGRRARGLQFIGTRGELPQRAFNELFACGSVDAIDGALFGSLIIEGQQGALASLD